MGIYELYIGWAASTKQRRYLHWEVLACDDVCGVFLTARDDVLAVVFNGDRPAFREWARSLEPTTTTSEGALG
jgi:hypothetical protein